jgi:hypothetical protein
MGDLATPHDGTTAAPQTHHLGRDAALLSGGAAAYEAFHRHSRSPTGAIEPMAAMHNPGRDSTPPAQISYPSASQRNSLAARGHKLGILTAGAAAATRHGGSRKGVRTGALQAQPSGREMELELERLARPWDGGMWMPGAWRGDSYRSDATASTGGGEPGYGRRMRREDAEAAQGGRLGEAI